MLNEKTPLFDDWGWLQYAVPNCPSSPSAIRRSAPVNSDQVDTLGDVAHQSFSFRTRSNGLFRLPQCFISEPCGPSVGDSGLAPSDRRPPVFCQTPEADRQ